MSGTSRAKDRDLILFGTGEISSLARFYFEADSRYRVVGFTADDEFVTSDTFEDLPLVPFSAVTERFPPERYEMHVALSYRRLNRIRAEKYLQAKARGYALASYVCLRSVTWHDLSVGDNCFILENQTIQPTVRIGSNVMIWSGNHLGHGCQIGDHVYIASHVVLSGHTVIGERCFLGVNATVRDFVTIGADSFITMDASVTADVAPGSVVLPGRGTVFGPETRQARTIKTSYFALTEQDLEV